MEVVGVVLGVLPLLISAIEHYEFFAPFVCHSKFTRELQDFRRKLDARKLLFRNHCRLLLADLVHEDLLEEMFHDGPRHTSWRDKDINERIKRHLGEPYEAYIDMIKAIDGHIEKLKEKTKGFGTVLAPKTGTETIGDHHWRQRVGDYMKLAVRKKGLDKDLDELKELNEDLRDLSRQIRDLKKGHKNRLQASADHQAMTRTSHLSSFHAIRKTSENLYQALARVSSCMVHKEHSATLCIVARPLGKIHDPRIRFNVAFRASMDGPVWINIESTITDASARGTIQVIQRESEALPLVTCPKRGADPLDTQLAVTAGVFKVAKLEHRCSSNASPLLRKQVTDTIGNESLSSGSIGIPNLSTQNFCFHIQQNAHNSTRSTECCAGFLREGACDHLLYLLPNPLKSKSKSLAQIMSSPSQDLPQIRYSRAERVRLAKLLAKAFFTESSQPLWALDAPHLSVRFPNESKTFEPAHTQSLAQNRTLFGLATILLELDFEKPLSHMRLPADVVENSPQDTEFKTAKRLARSTFPGLGPDFRKIIRKCLHCNFGIDETDLTKSEELKSKIHEEIICGLEDLEQALRNCTLVPNRTE
ncbi:hypothetical protein MMC27_005577 [Xylographa pallens]|nr:hypothetical protein [Xylographa pallens]